MNVLKATWTDGRVVLDGPADWPDGRRLEVREDAPFGITFLSEAEQGDDPVAVERWLAELRATPPVPVDEAAKTAWRAWEQQVAAFNVEAVRRQFEAGAP